MWHILFAIAGLAIFYLIFFSRRSKKNFGPQSVIPPGQKPKNGYGEIHRNSTYPDQLVEFHPDYPDVKTLYDVFRYAAKTYANTNFLGHRVNNGPYQWISYAEAMKRATAIGSGLVTSCELKPRDFVGLFSINNVSWVLSEKACNNYSLVSIPLYDTFGLEALEYILKITNLTTIVCTKNHIEKLLSISKKTNVKFLVQMDGEVSPESAKKSMEEYGVTLLELKDVESRGTSKPLEHIPPKSEDIATISFTSGTTGIPKGAVLTHKNFISDVASMMLNGVDLCPKDRHISYLPLAHLFERAVQVCSTWCGVSIGFYRGEVQLLMDDVAQLKPTIFCAVPRVYNRIYDRVMNTVNGGSALKQWLFRTALQSKVQGLASGVLTHFFWDMIVFKKVRAALGGHVRMFVTGSAPISDEVMSFFRAAFSAEFLEGYGMTECCAASCASRPGVYTVGNVGGPIPCSEIRLKSVPEMNYNVEDKPYPRGEVCFRGPNVFPGYYKDDENTRAAFPDGDEWLHSGDIGLWLPDGSLKIIDRKKNIFKLAQGEYVAPERIENVYARSKFVMQSFVYGDSVQSCLVGVVVPDFDVLNVWAKENGIYESDHSKLCENQKVRDLILKDIQRVAREGKLNGFEVINAMTLESEPFSVENGMLTPTMKPKRPQLKEKYLQKIKQMYEGLQKSR